MADQAPSFQFEDIPIEDARRMGRGPRMNPELYNALKQKIRSPDTTATRMPLPEVTNSTTMKNRIIRVAAELGVPVTVRKVPGGLIFWRSTDEDLQQAQEIAARLQSARQPPPAAQRSRRRRA